MQRTLLRLNLLEAQTVGICIEIIETRPTPLLILLAVLLLQARYILRELLQYFFLELTLGLTGAEVGSIDFLGAYLPGCDGRPIMSTLLAGR